jgi:hypothetical protein
VGHPALKRAHFEHLPIYKKGFDLLICTEGVVRHFSRYNKYTPGSDLRNQVRQGLKTILEVSNSAERRLALERLRLELETLMLPVWVGKDLGDHPKPANGDYLKSGQRENWSGTLTLTRGILSVNVSNVLSEEKLSHCEVAALALPGFTLFRQNGRKGRLYAALHSGRWMALRSDPCVAAQVSKV